MHYVIKIPLCHLAQTWTLASRSKVEIPSLKKSFKVFVNKSFYLELGSSLQYKLGPANSY